MASIPFPNHHLCLKSVVIFATSSPNVYTIEPWWPVSSIQSWRLLLHWRHSTALCLPQPGEAGTFSAHMPILISQLALAAPHSLVSVDSCTKAPLTISPPRMFEGHLQLPVSPPTCHKIFELTSKQGLLPIHILYYYQVSWSNIKVARNFLLHDEPCLQPT